MDIQTTQAYELLRKNADSDELLRNLHNVLSLPFIPAVDAGVYFTHYVPMLNGIREIYGREPLEESVIVPVLKGCRSEIFADIPMDKIISQIPLVRIQANIMCAKTLAWRLGILFAMLAVKDTGIREADVTAAARRIRKKFPQRSVYVFRQPGPALFDCLVNGTAVSADPFDVDAFFRDEVRVKVNGKER